VSDLRAIKNLFIIFSICLLLLLSVSAAFGTVHIKTTCYNSEVVVTEDLRTVNADYNGVTTLAPGFIISNGAGKSVEEEFSEFSHRIFAANDADHENIAAYLRTESGGFEWTKEVTALPDGLAMSMSVGCVVENGNLKAAYSNSRVTHTEELRTNGAKYSEVTAINPGTIASSGIGKSKKSSDEDKNLNSGLAHKIHVEGQGKWAEIRTNLTCNSTDTDYEWIKSVKALPENSSMGMALVCISNNGSIKKIEMDGEALNFPLKEFYDDFSKNPTALFYSIDQQCATTGGEDVPSGDSDISDIEYRRLGMSFVVRQP
jgi:hypothetical protein